MGLFSREEPVVEFESVVDTDGVIWPAWTDDAGQLWIDAEEGFEIAVSGAIVDGVIYDAWIDDHGQLRIDI